MTLPPDSAISPASSHAPGSWFLRNRLGVLFALSLLPSVAAALLFSLHWPLVGDSSLIHYVVFLIQNGRKPYKDILDINLPGSYLSEWLGMKIFGGGALAWRAYDLLLLALVGAAGFLVAGAKSRLAATVAGAMFLLLHLQDGIPQVGQRDLLIAALLLASYAALFAAQRRMRPGLLVFASSFCLGLTLTLKPTLLPLGVLLLLVSAPHMVRSGSTLLRHLSAGAAGLLLPPLAVLAWLASLGALPAFWNVASTLIPLHASLGRKPFAFLLTHAVAPIAPLVGLWLVVWLLHRPRWSLERFELLLGIAVALAGYVLQGKGYPYHRYPLLALLLLVINLDLFAALHGPRAQRWVATAALALQCLFFAPHAAWLVHTFRPAEPFEQALAQHLDALAPNLSAPSLSGHIQCLDTFGGCINTLYNQRLVQSTGFLYDCYLFTPQQTPATARYRLAFWSAFQSARPDVVVLTSQFCFGDPAGFARLDNWPQLRDELATRYTQDAEWHGTSPQRWWSRPEIPPSFRIYRRKP